MLKMMRITTEKLQNLNGGANYEYDEIGSLIADPSQDVTSIEWTPYGKVRSVTKSDGSVVASKYDASGNRIEKATTKDGTTTTLHYIRDASGMVMATYTDELLESQPIYGSSRLGMYKGGREDGKRDLGYKHYELSNHLGNVLAVVTDNIEMVDGETKATVVSANDYYPFGMEMPGRSISSIEYKYGFNGKEKDQNGEFGNTQYDYGFRIYNPEITKFLSTDPLSPEFPMLTPYQFASNTPIWARDLDGLEADPMTSLKQIDYKLKTMGVRVDELDIHRLNYERCKLLFRIFDLKFAKAKGPTPYMTANVVFNSDQALTKYYRTKNDKKPYDPSYARKSANAMINRFQEVFYNFKENNTKEIALYDEGQEMLRMQQAAFELRKYLNNQEITSGDVVSLVFNGVGLTVSILAVETGIGVASAVITFDNFQGDIQKVVAKLGGYYDPNETYTIGGRIEKSVLGTQKYYDIFGSVVAGSRSVDGAIRIVNRGIDSVELADTIFDAISAGKEVSEGANKLHDGGKTN